MKKIIIATIFISLLLSCSKEEVIDDGGQTIIEESNRMLMLKVDYQTLTFEGGTELYFSSNIEVDSIPMQQVFLSPGDFGGITLTHIPTNELIFDGTIVWAGLGERTFPAELEPASFFTLNDSEFIDPELESIQEVNPIPDPGQIATTNFSSIWPAVSNLESVQYYMEQGASVGLLTYTPSVGIGDPADWDYYILFYL